MKLIIRLLVNSIAVLIAAYIVPGVQVNGFLTALFVAIILGVLNIFLKPLLILLTLPITILTLGLFTFVINAIIILIVGVIIPGFHVNGFFSALLFAIVLSIVNALISTVVQ